MKLNYLASTAFACTLTALLSTAAFAGDVEITKGDDSKATVTSGTDKPTSLNLMDLHETFVGASSVRQGPSLGKQSVVHSDFDYSHRFHTTGNWYLRVGVEYERYDFGRTITPLPTHLQAATADIAYEYVVQDYAAAAIEIHPGFYYQNDASSRSFAVPVDIYSAFPIKKDKVFGMIGAYYSPFIDPPVFPLGGIIWLISDKWRLEALFPRPALIYTMNDDWEFRLAGNIGGGGFRMDGSSNNVPRSNYQGAVLQYESYEAGVQVKYTHWKGVDITLGAGYSAEREFDFFRDGPFQKYKAVGAPYVQLALETKF